MKDIRMLIESLRDVATLANAAASELELDGLKDYNVEDLNTAMADIRHVFTAAEDIYDFLKVKSARFNPDDYGDF